mgnify:FL=1
MKANYRTVTVFALALVIFGLQTIYAQGVTTASFSGRITDQDGAGLVGANVIATHVPSGTQYGGTSRDDGWYNLLNLRVGGPYTINVTYMGFEPQSQENIHANLNQDLEFRFMLAQTVMALEAVSVTAERSDVLNADRTGAATFISPAEVAQMPSIKRSTRDLTRLDPRSDGNFSFGGRNWLYNNISLDGSYFNNPFGLDDPAPGGQTNSELVSYDAVEQVQVSIAPFDVREGGFTGAGINTVSLT